LKLARPLVFSFLSKNKSNISAYSEKRDYREVGIHPAKRERGWVFSERDPPTYASHIAGATDMTTVSSLLVDMRSR
jgi:hypothetical protein